MGNDGTQQGCGKPMLKETCESNSAGTQGVVEGQWRDLDGEGVAGALMAVGARLRKRLMPAPAASQSSALLPHSQPLAEEVDPAVDLPTLWRTFIADELKVKDDSYGQLTVVRKLVMHRLTAYLCGIAVLGPQRHGAGLDKVVARCLSRMGWDGRGWAGMKEGRA